MAELSNIPKALYDDLDARVEDVRHAIMDEEQTDHTLWNQKGEST